MIEIKASCSLCDFRRKSRGEAVAAAMTGQTVRTLSPIGPQRTKAPMRNNKCHGSFLRVTVLIFLAFISAGCERMFLADDSLRILEVEGGRAILLKSDAQYLAPLTVEGLFPASKWTTEIFIGKGDDSKFEEGEYWTIYKTDGSIRDFRELGRGEIWIGEKTWRIKLKFEHGSDMLMRLNGTHQAGHLGSALPNEIVNVCRPLIEMPLHELLNLAESSTDTVEIAGNRIPLSDLIMSLVKSDALYGYGWHHKPGDRTWEEMKIWGYVYIPNGGLSRVKAIYNFEEKRSDYIAWCKKNLRGEGYLRNFLKEAERRQVEGLGLVGITGLRVREIKQ